MSIDSDQAKRKEKSFYKKLNDVFIGQATKGDSGFIKLMGIKRGYFKRLLAQFQREANDDLRINDSFREEFFDKLYSFFDSYFSESGSVLFQKTPVFKRLYDRIYTEDQDVMLFYKTRMLYYVKSEALYKDMEVPMRDLRFEFKVGELNRIGNEKKALLFTYGGKEEANPDEAKKVRLDVSYATGGKRTKLKNLAKEIGTTEKTVEEAIRTFKRQTEVDFFINKDAKGFLKEQLRLTLHKILTNDENKFTHERVEQVQAIRDYAEKLIGFVSQFEEELARIWRKPKFARKSRYVITLGRVAEVSPRLVDELVGHENVARQEKEWNDLNLLEGSVDGGKVWEAGQQGKTLASAYKNLPVDTRYFPDWERALLGQVEDLDKALDGRLIRSDNWQALNTLLPKYRGKVQCIYIDPPFNLGQNADFDYNVNYKDSTWLTMLENRLRLARELLSETGSLFLRCDYNGNHYVRMLLDNVFGEENFRNEIIINTTQKFFKGSQRYNVATNSLLWYSKSEDVVFQVATTKREDQDWLEAHSGGERKPPERVILGELVLPPIGRHWTFKQDKIDEMERENRIRWKPKEYIDINGENRHKIVEYLMAEDKFLNSNWTDIPGYSSTTDFATENSEKLLERVLETGSKPGDLVMDFFMGSATTQAVAHKLGRKWIGVDIGEHFDTVALRRMKSVFGGRQSGISKDLRPKFKGGGFLKYYSLEQYEDTLARAQYQHDADPQAKLDSGRSDYEQYIFFADRKFAEAIEVGAAGDSPIVRFDPGKICDDIDLAETLSNLTGRAIVRVRDERVFLAGGAEGLSLPLSWKSAAQSEVMELLRLLQKLLWWGE